jgi:hypothetical protein
MRPVAVVVLDVLVQHGFEVTSSDDDHPIKAFTADGADEALGKCVCTRSSGRCADDSNALALEDLVEG